MGRDFTIFATMNGVVRYEREGRDRTRVSVYTPDQLKMLANLKSTRKQAQAKA
jgi:large subunit ribosomal protein L27